MREDIRTQDELANAISMFSFIALSFLHVPLIYRLAITLLWVSACIYHLALSMANENVASIFFVGDIVSQVGNIIVLCNGSPCYSVPWKYSMIAIYMGGILRIYFIAIPFQTALQRKDSIRSVSIATHITHMCAALWFASNHLAIYKSLWYLLMVGVAFFIHDMGVPFMWALGHVACSFYTMYCWQGLGILRW